MEEKNVYLLGRPALELELLKVVKVEAKDGGTKEAPFGSVERPFMVSMINEDKSIELDLWSTKSAYAQDWSKKFKRNSSGYITWSAWDDVILALIEVLKANEKDGGKRIDDLIDERNFDVKKEIEGMKFEAVVKEGKSGMKFIDWVETFRHNKVLVPELPRATITVAEDSEKTEELDTSDLPF